MGFNRNVVKCALVGDGMVGKTCLARKFSGLELPEQYISTVIEEFTGTTVAYGQKYTVNIADTAGQFEDSRCRKAVYRNSDVCIVCYSVLDRDSMENVASVWIPEIRKNSKNIPIILVATQQELREEGCPDHVSSEEGRLLSDKLSVDCFAETSAYKNDGVKETFESAIKVVIMNKKAKSKWLKSFFGS